MAMINYKKMFDAIRGLNALAYEVWKYVVKCVSRDDECYCVKLNSEIVKDLFGEKQNTNASRAIKQLIDNELILPTRDYKDLYLINPNMYFRGDYTSFVIDYLSANCNNNFDKDEHKRVRRRRKQQQEEDNAENQQNA